MITRKTSERLFDFSFRYTQRRKARGAKGLLTCVDKANAFKAYAFFRKMFDECAARHPAVATDRLYVDACAAMLVRRPWDFDVMVMENMFGDILSDLTAGLIGGMGMAPSADIGDKHAVFQPCHGTAPDIMGKGLANPTAMILSTALMLDWLADRHDHAPAADARKSHRGGGRSGLRGRPQTGRIRRSGRHRGGRRRSAAGARRGTRGLKSDACGTSPTVWWDASRNHMFSLSLLRPPAPAAGYSNEWIGDSSLWGGCP